MVDTVTDEPRHADRRRGTSGVTAGQVAVLAVVVGAQLVGRAGWLANDELRLWSTLFVSICVQAFPFLVLGVTISGLVAAFVSPSLVERVLPRRSALAVPAAGVAGFALPGCECGSVPISARLASAGVPPAAALTFLLAAPAINPVVLVSTAVAFPAEPRMVIARLVAGFTVAVAVGGWWAWRGGIPLLDRTGASAPRDSRLQRFAGPASHDFVHAGGYLVLGAAVAATLHMLVPRSTLESLGGNEVLAVVTLAIAAVILSICSEADAFVAAGLPQFSLTSRLVFLVVGPVIDVKLVAMQIGVFGRRFARVFAPVTLLTAVAVAVVVGQVLL